MTANPVDGATAELTSVQSDGEAHHQSPDNARQSRQKIVLPSQWFYI